MAFDPMIAGMGGQGTAAAGGAGQAAGHVGASMYQQALKAEREKLDATLKATLATKAAEAAQKALTDAQKRYETGLKSSVAAVGTFGSAISGAGAVFADLAHGNVLGAMKGLAAGAAAAAGALGGPAAAAATRAVTGAFMEVATAGKAAYDSMMNLGRAASPALTKTFDEATGLLMSTIGVAFAPMLLFAGVAALSLADMFKESAFKIAKATADFLARVGGGATGVLAFLSQFSPSDLLELGGGFTTIMGAVQSATAGASPEVSKGLFTGGKGAEMLGMFMRSMEVNAGQTKPRFEGAADAFKRIQQAEAGMTDIGREQVKLQREMLETLREIAHDMAGGGDTDETSFGGGDWG